MFQTVALLLAGAAALAVAQLLRVYLTLWLRAVVTGTRISLPSLVLMSLRQIDPRTIVDCQIMALQAGLPRYSPASMETHLLAGGDIRKVTRALIAARWAGITLNWQTAAAVDLAGRDILEAVQTSVNPQVIDCPAIQNGKRATINGVAKDGIQLQVRARVTVRTNLLQLIGGATERTIAARVGQGIVSAIGGCETFRMALANPLFISAEVLRRGLDAQTAYAIVSIDIEEIAVGDNVGAGLQLEQARADMRIAQAEAEKRRAMALAHLQEMQALVQENRALVMRAETEVPKAIAHAYRVGQLYAEVQPSSLPKVRSSSTAMPLRAGGNWWVRRVLDE